MTILRRDPAIKTSEPSFDLESSSFISNISQWGIDKKEGGSMTPTEDGNEMEMGWWE